MSLHLLTPSSSGARVRLLLAACTLALLSACQSAPPQPAAASPARPASVAPPADAMAGGDKPATPILGGPGVETHGCKASTGHAWCERSQRCERPWELALQRGFENTPDGWHAYCDGATR